MEEMKVKIARQLALSAETLVLGSDSRGNGVISDLFHMCREQLIAASGLDAGFGDWFHPTQVLMLVWCQ